jgi:hypothetical protein
MIYVDGKWKIMNKNELVDDIYENKRDYIIQNLDNFIGQLDEYKKKSLIRWLDTNDNEDEAIINTKNDIKKVLYENRKMAMDRKKELENIEKKKKLEIVKRQDVSNKKYLIKKQKSLSSNSDNESSSSYDSSYVSNYSYLSAEVDIKKDDEHNDI